MSAVTDPVKSLSKAIMQPLGLYAQDPNVTVALPTAEKPATMPTADDEAVRSARRRALADIKRRQGRQSTILTSNLESDTLG